MPNSIKKSLKLLRKLVIQVRSPITNMAGRGTGHYLQKKKAGGLANRPERHDSPASTDSCVVALGRQSRKFEFM
jgi:hypothetical protein